MLLNESENDNNKARVPNQNIETLISILGKENGGNKKDLVQTALGHVKTGIFVVDKAFQALQAIELSNGSICIKSTANPANGRGISRCIGASLNEFQHHLKCGNLNEILRIAEVHDEHNTSNEKAFSELIGPWPEKELFDILVTLKNEKQMKVVRDALKRSNTGIAAVDNAFHKLTVNKFPNGLLRIGVNTHLNEFYNFVKSGDLKSILEIAELETLDLESAEAAFEKLVGPTIELQLRLFDKFVNDNRKNFIRFDKPWSELSPALRAEIEQIEHNMHNIETSLLHGGQVSFGRHWITNYSNNYYGCRWFKKSPSGFITSCLVEPHSCKHPFFYVPLQCHKFPQGNFYNVTLSMIHLAKNPQLKEAIALCKNLNIKPAEFFDQLPELLFQETAWNIMQNFAAENRIAFDLCETHHPKLTEHSTECVTCDSSVSPTSVQYLDTALIPSGSAFRCVKNYTVLEVLSEAAMATGKSIYDFTKSSGPITCPEKKQPQNIAIIIAVIAVAIISLCAVIKLMFFSTKNNEAVPRNEWRKIDI